MEARLVIVVDAELHDKAGLRRRASAAERIARDRQIEPTLRATH